MVVNLQPIVSMNKEGGIPSLSDPTPHHKGFLYTPVPGVVSFYVFFILVCCVLIMALSCSRKAIVCTVNEPEQVKEAQIFPDEEGPPALVQKCVGIEAGRLYFGFDRSDVDEEGVRTVEALAGYLRSCEGILVKVGGYCDERGSLEYNYGLGKRRADAAVAELIGRGVEAARLKAFSYGEGGLAVEGCRDEGCHEKNRRVEFQLEGVK